MALVVFTGGARSGKSGAATRLAATHADARPVTVVVFGRAVDAEFARRIAKHRVDRPEHWSTLEVVDVASWTEGIAEDGVVLVDCLGTMLGLIMDDVAAVHDADASAEAGVIVDDRAFGAEVTARLEAAVEWLVARPGDTIVVTNEVGDGIVPAYPSGRLFRDALGAANRRLVSAADAAYLCVAGRMLALDALPTDPTWPED